MERAALGARLVIGWWGVTAGVVRREGRVGIECIGAQTGGCRGWSHSIRRGGYTSTRVWGVGFRAHVCAGVVIQVCMCGARLESVQGWLYGGVHGRAGRWRLRAAWCGRAELACAGWLRSACGRLAVMWGCGSARACYTLGACRGIKGAVCTPRCWDGCEDCPRVSGLLPRTARVTGGTWGGRAWHAGCSHWAACHPPMSSGRLPSPVAGAGCRLGLTRCRGRRASPGPCRLLSAGGTRACRRGSGPGGGEWHEGSAGTPAAGLQPRQSPGDPVQ